MIIKVEKVRHLLVIITILFFLSCAKEETVLVHDELKEYFIRFETEAMMRNREISTRTIGAELQHIADNSVSGQCQKSDEGNKIVIDAYYWSQADEYKKEFLVFHELGHCILGRPHLDTKNSDGTCASIMHSSSRVCNSNYNDKTRAALLDELFSQ